MGRRGTKNSRGTEDKVNVVLFAFLVVANGKLSLNALICLVLRDGPHVCILLLRFAWNSKAVKTVKKFVWIWKQIMSEDFFSFIIAHSKKTED